MKKSSRAYVPFLMRTNVLNPTATSDKKRKIDERTMTASGRPFGAINLAVGSTPFEGVAITKRVRREVGSERNGQENSRKPHPENPSPPL